jgi:hypothetical protein
MWLVDMKDRIAELERDVCRLRKDKARLIQAGDALLKTLDKHATASFGEPESSFRDAIDAAKER